MQHVRRISALSATLTLLPAVASAHPGHDFGASFVGGVLHPFTGWDHLTVLLCLGALAAGRGARFALLAGCLLAMALSGGAAVGVAFPAVPFVEPAILLTVLVSVSLLALRVRLTRNGLLALCLGFTAVHGLAHGQEAPAAHVIGYFSGFTLAGAAIFAAGLLLAERLRLSGHGRGARP